MDSLRFVTAIPFSPAHIGFEGSRFIVSNSLLHSQKSMKELAQELQEKATLSDNTVESVVEQDVATDQEMQALRTKAAAGTSQWSTRPSRTNERSLGAACKLIWISLFRGRVSHKEHRVR